MVNTSPVDHEMKRSRNRLNFTYCARKITRMEGVDRRREAVEAASPFSPNYDPAALELFAVDRDFNSAQDALAWLGGVVDYDTFSKAVN